MECQKRDPDDEKVKKAVAKIALQYFDSVASEYFSLYSLVEDSAIFSVFKGEEMVESLIANKNDEKSIQIVKDLIADKYKNIRFEFIA
jgi:predicted nucleotidyltransferase